MKLNLQQVLTSSMEQRRNPLYNSSMTSTLETFTEWKDDRPSQDNIQIPTNDASSAIWPTE